MKKYDKNNIFELKNLDLAIKDIKKLKNIGVSSLESISPIGYFDL